MSQGTEDSWPEVSLGVELLSNAKARGVITINGQTVTTTGPARIVKSKPVGKGINLSGTFRITKGDIGVHREGMDRPSDEIILSWWIPARPLPKAAQVDMPQEASIEELIRKENTPAQPTYSARTWTSQDGREIEATFVRMKEAGIVLELGGGQETTVPIERFSAGDQEWVSEQTGVRPFRNQAGVTIWARYRGLADDTVTIENLNGQSFDISLSTLHKDDQKWIQKQK